MNTILSFHPIIKYSVIMIISFMFLNSLKLQNDILIKIIIFILAISLTMDVFMIDDYIHIMRNEKVTDAIS